MSEFKEFQAKNLDQAIQDACSHFGAEREKLEIEIIEDAKMGVFGIIGARKAKIRARMVSLPEFAVNPAASAGEDRKQKPFGRNGKPKSRPYHKNENFQKAENDKLESLEKKVKFDKAEKFEKSFEKNFEDDEEGESQKRFLSRMHSQNNLVRHDMRELGHHEEELDEHELEAMDREAMQRANLLGNMTEAEIIAGGHYDQDRNGRYQRNNRHSRFQPRQHEYRERNEQRHFDKQDGRNSHDSFGRENADRNSFDKQGYERQGSDRQGYDRQSYEKHGKYRKFDRQDRPYRSYKNDGFDRNERPRFEKDKFDRYEKNDRFDRFEKGGERKSRFQNKRSMRPQHEARSEMEFEGVQLPKVNLLELEQEKLVQQVRETISKLVSPIVGDEAPIEITVEENRILVKIESEDSGLLIGREGQHLAAIQYLAARILTIKMQVQIRIQLDTGDYHQRQDERMQSLALMLADRVRKTGRSQSTRPMSAYQRRVIHLALQEEADVQTRSVGDGVLKRVIIMKKRDYSNNHEEYAENADSMIFDMVFEKPTIEEKPDHDDMFADDYSDDDYDDPFADENCDECDFPNENDFDEEKDEIEKNR